MKDEESYRCTSKEEIKNKMANVKSFNKRFDSFYLLLFLNFNLHT